MAGVSPGAVRARQVLAIGTIAGAVDKVRWHDLARLYTPVTAAPVQRTPPGQSPAIPASGGRWGNPSAFSWSREAAQQSPAEQSVTDRTPSGSPPEYMRIIDAQLLVASEKVRVTSPNDPSVWVDIDRLRRMVFHYTEFPPKSSPSGLTPTRTTYFDLSFDLHPSPSEEA